MDKRSLLFLWVASLSVFSSFAQNDTVRDDQASDFNLNKPERVEWFRNTGAGLFIHFGVDGQLGIVISHSLVGASDDYVDRYFSELPRTFDPSRWNPHEIAVLARLAGMKYIVFTTKHHSGFCMWDTRTTPFNVMNTPFHKDLLKEYVEATRAEGLGVGFYFSPEDFYFLHQHHLPVSRTDVQMDAATRKAYDDYNRSQCEELMTHYGKIDVLFIDGEPKEVVKQTCWKLQPDLLITRGAMKTPEQVLPGGSIPDPWLSCITMGTAWQYQPTNERYKTGNQLIGLAIEARAKGGSLLLNVGPKPNGELPIEQEERLREMAAWYFINHECMDSVNSWVVSREKDTWFTAKKDKTLYAIVTDTRNWKEGERKTFLLHSVKGKVDTRISVLGQNSQIIEYKKEDVGCRYRQTPEGLEVSVVKAQRIYDDHRWPNPVVIKLENIAPVFAAAVSVQTGDYKTGAEGMLLTGSIGDPGSGGPAEVSKPSSGPGGRSHDAGVKSARFYYRPYTGQVETLYAEEWKTTPLVPIQPDGSFSLLMTSFEKNKQYEYKAVALQSGVEIEGQTRICRGWSAGAPASGAKFPQLAAPLIPRPVHYEQKEGQFLLNAATRIYSMDSDASLLAKSLRDFTGLSLHSTSTPGDNTIQWTIDSSQVTQAEGYTLQVDPARIFITGHDSAGLFYGIQSLLQLLHPQKATQFQNPQARLRQPVFTVASCSITDYPRFSYRGLHLDVCRHFFPVTAIRKWIDLLALYKFNSFHWHLTDDQGWRIEIKKYPRLQSVAAWRNETLIGHKKELPHHFDGKRYGGYYTRQEVKDIVRYAADRNITVIPEIEMPGHARAALAAYPSLGCTGGPYSPATFWGVFDDVYCAGNDSVFTFLRDVLDEVMTLFPSRYLHIGGDECPKTRWAACPKCRQRIKDLGLKDEHELQSWFVQRIEKYLNSKGRQIIGWDEILEGGLAPGATVMSWRGEEGGLAAARGRHRVIMAPESHLYFDYYQSLYPEEPLSAGNYTPLSKVYSYEPLTDSPDKEALSYVAGIEGALWTEYASTVSQVEYKWFPRALAVAEIAWSPAAGRNYDDFLRRLRAEEGLLKKLDIHSADNFDEITYTAAPAGPGRIKVSLSSSLPAAQIRYTLDNTEPGPNSALYTEPLIIRQSCMLKASLPGQRLFHQYFQLHQAVGSPVSLLHLPSGRYAPPAATLVNGITGSDRYNDGQWLGFSGDDLEAVIDLGAAHSIHNIGINVLNYHWQKMWAPLALQFFISSDGINYKEIYRQDRFPVNGINRVRYSFPPQEARYIKVTGVNKGVIPAGEYGAGGKAWLMTDEIMIE